MRVLFATAELAPLFRVGGLAEAASGLVRALRADGLDVTVAVPDYGNTPLEDEHVEVLEVPHWVGSASTRTGEVDGFGEITFVHVPGIDRGHPYVEPVSGAAWPDNDRRFFGFSAAVASLATTIDADVVHVNDWHTAAALAFLRPDIPTVLSIHNLAYQGMADGRWLGTVTVESRRDAYECFGAFNPLGGAIECADRIVAVSPTYAREILDPSNGFGLEGVLRQRGSDVVGILNGIDHDEWNPAADRHLAATYSKPAAKAKAECRAALLDEAGLDPSGTGPVIGMVTRLVEQKGVDLLLDAAQYLSSWDARLVVLGAGEPGLAAALHQAQAAAPGVVSFREGYDLGFAHRIFGGADLFVMPSRFEPCGLAQMQAMAYGTIPVTTSVGGLVDTVIDADSDPVLGNGYRSPHNSGAGLVDALHRAVRGWLHGPTRKRVVENGMGRDWSWAGPAQQYRSLYESLGA